MNWNEGSRSSRKQNKKAENGIAEAEDKPELWVGPT